MAYQLLKQRLPNDIVDFCITPFLTISESEVRANYQKVLRDIEQGTLKGMTGLFYVIYEVMLGIQPLPANMPADLVHLLQANANGNERYLHKRRLLIRDGHKAADLDQLTDEELETLYYFQRDHNRQRQDMLRELEVRKSHTPWQEQFDILTTNGIQPPHPIAQIHPHVIEDEDDDNDDNDDEDEAWKSRERRLHAMVLDTISDLSEANIRWIVGTTATGQKVCRMSTANPRCFRNRQLLLVTENGVQISNYVGLQGARWNRPLMVLRSENPERYNRIVSLRED